MDIIKSVLLIDHHDENREWLSSLLEDNGFSVTAFPAADNAQRICRELQPGIVLIEYLLPSINGGELCAQLKHQALTGHIPIILLTDNARVLNSLGNYGCNDIIERPYNPKTLLAGINRYFDRS